MIALYRRRVECLGVKTRETLARCLTTSEVGEGLMSLPPVRRRVAHWTAEEEAQPFFSRRGSDDSYT